MDTNLLFHTLIKINKQILSLIDYVQISYPDSDRWGEIDDHQSYGNDPWEVIYDKIFSIKISKQIYSNFESLDIKFEYYDLDIIF